jgi:5'-phosphate synthase pdxT subunit
LDPDQLSLFSLFRDRGQLRSDLADGQIEFLFFLFLSFPSYITALQGAFQEHIILLNTLPQVSEAVAVRNAQEIAQVDALIIPGGESTTMALIAERSGFWPSLQEYVQTRPTWGTCAGMILLSEKITSGGTLKGDQKLLGGLGISIKRNAFGSQKESFEAGLHIQGLQSADRLFPGVFIRAPAIDEILVSDETDSHSVEVLAKLERDYGQTPKGTIVAVKRNHLLGTAFHPELTRDSRMHQYFVEMAQEWIAEQNN